MESEKCESGSWSPGMSGLEGQKESWCKPKKAVLYEEIWVVLFCFVFPWNCLFRGELRREFSALGHERPVSQNRSETASPELRQPSGSLGSWF